MSHIIATIHQGTISDENLLKWLLMYFHIATSEHQKAALRLFKHRAEQMTIASSQRTLIECVFPTTNPIPGKTRGKCHPIPEYR